MDRRRSGAGRVALWLAVAVVWPAVGHAGQLAWYGCDAAAIAGAGSAGAFGEGIGVVHSNPSLLADLPPVSLAAGFVLVRTGLLAELFDRPAGADVPLSYYDSDVGVDTSEGVTDRPLPTVELPVGRHDNRQTGFTGIVTLGLTHNLWTERLRAGLLLALPLSGMADISTHYDNEQAQYNTNTVHFTRFGEWDRLFSGMAGLAWRPLDWLQLGGSVQVATRTVIEMRTYVPDSSYSSYVLPDTSMRLASTFRPVAGVAVRPFEWLSIGLAWRHESVMRSDTTTRTVLWNLHDNEPGPDGNPSPLKVSESTVPMVFNFEPMEIAGTLGLRFGGLTAQATVTGALWSRYRDHHDRSPQQTAAFAPVNPGDPGADGGRFAFRNTLVVQTGLAWRYLGRYTARAGFAFHQSPVPDQTGRSNYADNHLFVGSAGHGFAFGAWEIDAGLQVWGMPRLTVWKDPSLVRDEFPDSARTVIGGYPMPEAAGLQTNNPGFPGYAIRGWEVVAALSARYRF